MDARNWMYDANDGYTVVPSALGATEAGLRMRTTGLVLPSIVTPFGPVASAPCGLLEDSTLKLESPPNDCITSAVDCHQLSCWPPVFT